MVCVRRPRVFSRLESKVGASFSVRNVVRAKFLDQAAKTPSSTTYFLRAKSIKFLVNTIP